MFVCGEDVLGSTGDLSPTQPCQGIPTSIISVAGSCCLLVKNLWLQTSLEWRVGRRVTWSLCRCCRGKKYFYLGWRQNKFFTFVLLLVNISSSNNSKLQCTLSDTVLHP